MARQQRVTHLHHKSRSHGFFLLIRFCSGSSAWVLVVRHFKRKNTSFHRLPASSRKTPPMDRVRWSGKAIPFRSLVDNPAIQKPALGKHAHSPRPLDRLTSIATLLVQIGTKAIVVGEKINGEFIMASPCKVSGDRFDVMEEEIVVSSKHTGSRHCSCDTAPHPSVRLQASGE